MNWGRSIDPTYEHCEHRNYGVLYLSGQASWLQGGAAQGGVKFQKYRAPNELREQHRPRSMQQIQAHLSYRRLAWADVLN